MYADSPRKQALDTRVMSTDGQELETVHNVTFNTVNGNLRQVVIDTDARELFGKTRW
jgi:sporulation protein YlmC with PRC-barrel domain